MMKKYHLIIIIFFTASFAFAQTKDKQKEKPPTQKEMDEMMKEMQNALNEMSPEEKKAMDSMGIT
ncbi:MAG TPA: hypothetical protein VFV68_09830, partial [Agriterribacter sp.]|nr:hypothetical protein [Agriterribacter sp.]